VENYIKLYHQFASPFNLFEQVNTLDANLNHMSKFQIMAEYEKLDNIRCQTTALAKAK